MRAPNGIVHALAQTPYRAVLGERYDQLHPHVRAAHEPLTALGNVDVVHGGHILTPLLVRMMNLPAAGTATPVRLVVDVNRSSGRTTPTMTWMRQIGATRLNTRQFARNGRLVEQSGPGRVEFFLQVDATGALLYQSSRCRFLGVRLPQAMSPRVRAIVAPTITGWHVDVSVEWRGHAICRYHGAMRAIAAS